MPPGRVRARRVVAGGVRAAGCAGLVGEIVIGAVAGGCGRPASGVRGSGTIEMDEIDAASLTGGRVARIAVDEGDMVRIGDTLAVLEQSELAATVEVRRAEAERMAALAREVARGP